MQFNRKNLLKAVRTVAKVIPTRSVMPILSCVFLGATKVIGTDLDQWLTVKVSNFDIDRTIIVTPAKPLIALLAGLTTDDVTIIQNGDHITVNGFTLESFDIIDIPLPPKVDAISNPVLDLKRALDLTQWAASIADYHSTSVLGGVYFKGAEVTATDGSRMSNYVSLSDTGLDCIIPAGALKVVQSLLVDNEISTMSADKDHVKIVGDNFETIIRLISGEYPRYHELFPTKFASSITFDRKQCLAALKSLKPGIDKQTNLVHFDDGSLSHDTGAVNLSPTHGHSGPVRFAVNWHYFNQLVESCPDDKVTINYNGPIKPLVLNHGAYRHLLMPVQSKRAEQWLKEKSKAAVA
jgi:DNA polymerase III sliding clamp (beta) subunit (PCNA family)